ncbi:TetR/AcrR family transcriptional regulator [Curtobacterium sp. VKM Ac-2922]|uniref:TetR/AcrR family transcriptional regulator n=1 Tax=Curtobacterium sp. VKM Ac-2922 TaxID=2929475 RepID=UPI001FB2152C|nr:TetR/AcrR family transcriptional regulator [Curtobacterium sp. VKM Ac-2922]MCJ1712962.1 TetR/AcrR family transcriptional regulator [Curtobacterium sp. VKM Ac-2922]
MEGADIRVRVRRALQNEIAVVAIRLFAENGFDAVTVDQIAAQAGLSRRSFFRYFSSKEDVVTGKYTLWAEALVDAHRALPDGGDPWWTLRATFDSVVDYYSDPVRRSQQAALEAIIEASPSLRSAVAAVLWSLQDGLADALLERGGGTSAELSSIRARAMAGAAWACVQAALPTAATGDFAGVLDELFQAFAPTWTGSQRGAASPSMAQRSGGGQRD